jgi:predicted Zn-dependent protease
MEWSGYELDGAADFWRRMAAENPGSIKDSYTSTHPSTSQRFVEIEQSEVEINEKLLSGENLLPNMK